MSTLFTPGPWERIVHGDHDSRIGAKTLIAIVYSEAFRDHNNQIANAQLISAAPDLLSALKSTLSTLDFAIQKGVLECHGVREHALAAIKKAEGR